MNRDDDAPLPIPSGLDWAAEPAAETQTSGAYSVRLDQHGPRKIAVIKLIRELMGVGLKEAKELSETPGSVILEGVTKDRAYAAVAQFSEQGAFAVVEGADGPVTTAPVGDANHVTLVLTRTGPRKINIIKIIRETSGLGLKESKDMSENVPAILSTRLTRDRAERALREIRDVGGDGRIDGM